jgi:hypothetical protein
LTRLGNSDPYIRHIRPAVARDAIGFARLSCRALPFGNLWLLRSFFIPWPAPGP